MRHGRALITAVIAWSVALSSVPAARAQDGAAEQRLREAGAYFQSGSYFRAARYAFDARSSDQSPSPEAYALITLSLIRAQLPQSASYFFIRTLQSGNKAAIRRILGETDLLMSRVGADLLRVYLVRHTTYEDYEPAQRSAYLLSLGKDALLQGSYEQAVGYVNGMVPQSPLQPLGFQIRATAYAILGKNEWALKDFQSCQDRADRMVTAGSDEPEIRDQQRREAEDLRARCQAGVARTLYQMERFEEADRAYDRIPKVSRVWPEILFEQGWNSFARAEYNRTLGKLVSYRSPALSFVYNPEIEVLRAQAYLGLCLYADANGEINDFNSRYASLGQELKRFIESGGSHSEVYWALGKKALETPITSAQGVTRLANRFVRGPYFLGMVLAERQLGDEREAIRKFAMMTPGVSQEASSRGFPGFLEQVLEWREKTIRRLGGVFVKNSFLDYHSALIADFEKMSFIKLEMLRRAKEKILYQRELSAERSRGNRAPVRRDDQYYWKFNGEFWNDELGDYVFGLESECRN